jgi:predicted nuclease of restriction endonuclease-like (RecB) superfamily
MTKQKLLLKRKYQVKTAPSFDIRFFRDIRDIIVSARSAAARNINAIQIAMNFEIGKRIIEHEQRGRIRAEYGSRLLISLSARLTEEFGKGFSLSNLKLMRMFYITYAPRIGQTVSGRLAGVRKSQTVSGFSAGVLKVPLPLTLSWSHYVFLLGINDVNERSFYEIEANQQKWSLRELKRQFNSGFYERLALSRSKAGIKKLAKKGQVVEKSTDLIKEPYVLEFLGLDEKSKYSESDLETAIIDKLEHFLLELGKGFLFEARQKRFTFDEDHFFVDLVFYNRLLNCYVLIDLKIGRLTHQDIGQMQMYVNYFDRYIKQETEKPTIGIILCKKKHDALVEITLPKDANIHAREFKLYLPDKEMLKQKLLDWSREQEQKPRV